MNTKDPNSWEWKSNETDKEMKKHLSDQQGNNNSQPSQDHAKPQIYKREDASYHIGEKNPNPVDYKKSLDEYCKSLLESLPKKQEASNSATNLIDSMNSSNHQIQNASQQGKNAPISAANLIDSMNFDTAKYVNAQQPSVEQSMSRSR